MKYDNIVWYEYRGEYIPFNKKKVNICLENVHYTYSLSKIDIKDADNSRY